MKNSIWCFVNDNFLVFLFKTLLSLILSLMIKGNLEYLNIVIMDIEKYLKFIIGIISHWFWPTFAIFFYCFDLYYFIHISDVLLLHLLNLIFGLDEQCFKFTDPIFEDFIFLDCLAKSFSNLHILYLFFTLLLDLLIVTLYLFSIFMRLNKHVQLVLLNISDIFDVLYFVDWLFVPVRIIHGWIIKLNYKLSQR